MIRFIKKKKKKKKTEQDYMKNKQEQKRKNLQTNELHEKFTDQEAVPYLVDHLYYFFHKSSPRSTHFFYGLVFFWRSKQ